MSSFCVKNNVPSREEVDNDGRQERSTTTYTDENITGVQEHVIYGDCEVLR